MVVVGTDAHKYSHTFVATDEVGRQLGEKTVSAVSKLTGRGVIRGESGSGSRPRIFECHAGRRRAVSKLTGRGVIRGESGSGSRPRIFECHAGRRRAAAAAVPATVLTAVPNGARGGDGGQRRCGWGWSAAAAVPATVLTAVPNGARGGDGGQRRCGWGWSGSNSRLPTTLNARDQPPAEVSDQRVSGLTGAVQIDLTSRSTAANDLPVTFKPGLKGGITEQISAFGLTQLRRVPPR